MMWIQTALPFFIKRIKSALGSHSYSSAGSSCLSVVKSHQHFRIDNAANVISRVERFMWAALALPLSWFGFCLITLASTTRGGKETQQPACNKFAMGPHAVAETTMQICWQKTTSQQTDCSRLAPPDTIWALGRGKLGGTKERVPKREMASTG